MPYGKSSDPGKVRGGDALYRETCDRDRNATSLGRSCLLTSRTPRRWWPSVNRVGDAPTDARADVASASLSNLGISPMAANEAAAL